MPTRNRFRSPLLLIALFALIAATMIIAAAQSPNTASMIVAKSLADGIGGIKIKVGQPDYRVDLQRVGLRRHRDRSRARGRLGK